MTLAGDVRSVRLVRRERNKNQLRQISYIWRWVILGRFVLDLAKTRHQIKRTNSFTTRSYVLRLNGTTRAGRFSSGSQRHSTNSGA